MSSTSPSGNIHRYESVQKIESREIPGVAFTVFRMSFRRRTELLERVRELTMKAEFLESGSTPEERIEGALLARQAGRIYLEWGLAGIEGLTIDGEPATPERLIERGPEALCSEVLKAIHGECGLTDDERKN